MRFVQALVTVALVTVVTFVVLSGTALAQGAGLVPYSGMLTTDSGEPLADGTYQVAFRVYDAVEGGSLLLEESYAIEVVDGRFDVMLGQQKPMINFADVPELWLEMQLEGQKPFLPRVWFTVPAVAEWSLWDELDPAQQQAFADTLRERIYDGMLRWWPMMEPEHQQIVLDYYTREFGLLRADAPAVLRRLADMRDLRTETFLVTDYGVDWSDDAMFDLPADVAATIERSNASSQMDFPFVDLCRYLRTDAPLRRKCP